MAYKFGSFNMYKFSDKEIRKDIDLIARIINEQQFDIIALQEVCNKYAMNLLMNRLNRLDRLGEDRWQGIWDSPNSFSSTAAEGYAYIWDKNRMRLATTYLQDGSTRVFKPHIYNQYRVNKSIHQRPLIRNPYYARFEPVNGPFCEFRLINIHIMFAKHNSTNDFSNVGAVSMRKQEFDILTQSLYLSIADKVYGNNRPSYTIILGDYNLNLPTSEARSSFLNEIVEVDNGGQMRRLVTIQKELTTLKSPQNNEQNDVIPNSSYWSNNYDHFTFDYDRFQGLGINTERVNTVKKYCNNDYELHRKIVSDHVPVSLDINLK